MLPSNSLVMTLFSPNDVSENWPAQTPQIRVTARPRSHEVQERGRGLHSCKLTGGNRKVYGFNRQCHAIEANQSPFRFDQGGHCEDSKSSGLAKGNPRSLIFPVLSFYNKGWVLSCLVQSFGCFSKSKGTRETGFGMLESLEDGMASTFLRRLSLSQSE